MDEIWGLDSTTDERTVDVHVNRLRERFKNCDDFIIMTVRGLGYKAVKTELYQIFPDSTLLADPPGLFLPGVLVDADADRIFCLAAHKRNR